MLADGGTDQADKRIDRRQNMDYEAMKYNDRDPEGTVNYETYHKFVVDECVRLTAEKHRQFYDLMDYREEWAAGEPAEETAKANVDATDWEEER
jgi:hypothetical protein